MYRVLIHCTAVQVVFHASHAYEYYRSSYPVRPNAARKHVACRSCYQVCYTLPVAGLYRAYSRKICQALSSFCTPLEPSRRSL